MNDNITRINESSFIITDGGVRMFLLTGRDRALLIDTGMNMPNARDVAESLTCLPVELLNTHADRDHTGGNGRFERFYMHPADEKQYRASGGSGEIIPIADGEVMDLGGRELEIIHLPGHTPGSVAVLDRAARVLISGDPIQRHGRIFMFGSRRSMPDYIQSLSRLEGLTDRFDAVWPSHADLPVGPDTVGALRRGAEEILSGRVPGRAEEMFGTPITAYDLGFCTLLCDR